MGLNWAEHTLEIAAPIETCFEAITDYETFPTWQSAVVDTEVLDHDDRGRGSKVRLFIDAKVRRVDYTLSYRYDEPTRIEWDFVEGNGIDGADGHYAFEELGDGRTRATYKLGLGLALPLPGMVARRAHSSTLKRSVEDLKREAERRAAAERPRAAAERPRAAAERPPAAPRPPAPETPPVAEPEPPRPEPRREPTGPDPLRPKTPQAAAPRPEYEVPAGSDGDSIRGAAADVVGSVVNLGAVVGSKTVGRVGRRVAGGLRRLRP
jgi:uncharacterized membrane protein